MIFITSNAPEKIQKCIKCVLFDSNLTYVTESDINI